MAALDAQQNFMPTKYIFFFLSLLAYIKNYSVFCENFAKAEHTICDCNRLGQDIQTNKKPFSSFYKGLTIFGEKMNY